MSSTNNTTTTVNLVQQSALQAFGVFREWAVTMTGQVTLSIMAGLFISYMISRLFSRPPKAIQRVEKSGEEEDDIVGGKSSSEEDDVSELGEEAVVDLNAASENMFWPDFAYAPEELIPLARENFANEEYTPTDRVLYALAALYYAADIDSLTPELSKPAVLQIIGELSDYLKEDVTALVSEPVLQFVKYTVFHHTPETLHVGNKQRNNRYKKEMRALRVGIKEVVTEARPDA